MKLRLFFLIVFSSFICWSYCIANPLLDSLSYSVKHYTDEDGLPQNSIKKIITDNFGFVWMTTEDGLVRFDGNNFTVFNKLNIKGLISNRFSEIRIGVDKALYAVTDKDDYIKIENGRVERDTPLNNHTSSCRASIDLERSLKKYREEKEGWAIGLPQRYLFNKHAIAHYVIPTDKGTFYEIHNDKIIFLDNPDEKKQTQISFPNQNVWDFFLIENDLYYFNPNGTITNITKDKISTISLFGDILKDPTYEHHKKDVSVLWNNITQTVVFYFNESFYLLKRATNGQLNTALIASGFNIENKQIISHYYDEQHKRLFLGSAVKGFYILNKKQFRVLSEKGDERVSVYYAQIPYDNNSVMTAQGTILGIDSLGKFFLRKKGNDLIDRYTIVSDQNKFIWIKQWANLYKCDREMHKLKGWNFSVEISTLYESADSVLWIGTRWQGGLYRMDISKEIVDPEYYCPIKDITFIVSKTPKVLLVGTSKGLYQLDLTTKTTKQITGLQDKYIQSIYLKTPDEIWVTTNEEGIFLIRNDKLTSLPRDKNNFLSAAHCIVEDEKGFFWIGTNKGLFQVARKDLLAYAQKAQDYVFYLYYGKENGFNTNEFNGSCEPCGVKLANGQISLPTLDGLVWFAPSSLITELPNKPIVIDRVEVDRKNIQINNDTIWVSRKFNQLQLFISTVYFGDRKNLQISYALVKENSSESIWYSISNDKAITFSTLLSGAYKLHIRKLNGFGENNYEERTITIIVPHAYFETWWFKILIFSLIAVASYLYIKFRVYKIEKNNKLLELVIKKRTRTLTNTLRALEFSESTLRRQTQIQEMLIAAISHDIKSPMKYLLLASKKMQQFILKKEYESLTVFNQGIQDTAAQIYGILDNLLKYISVQIKKGEVRLENVHLSEIINDKIATFYKIAQINYTIIKNNVPDNIVIKSSPELLSIIIHNLIDNSVKYTANGAITISAQQSINELKLIIEDTGTGISPELANWLNNNEVFNNKIEIDTASGHKGMGLIIVKELLALLRSKITAERIVSGGTRITILLVDLD